MELNKRHLKKVFLLLFTLSVLLTLSSCSSLSSYYVTLYSDTSEVLPASSVIYTADMESSSTRLVSDGYRAIGSLSYSGKYRADIERELQRLGKQKGAEIVLYTYTVIDVEDSNLSIEPVFSQYTRAYEGSSVRTVISFPVLSGAVLTFGSSNTEQLLYTAVFYSRIY